jgi:formylmethanofuran dehydrogenase subunit A
LEDVVTSYVGARTINSTGVKPLVSILEKAASLEIIPRDIYQNLAEASNTNELYQAIWRHRQTLEEMGASVSGSSIVPPRLAQGQSSHALEQNETIDH